MALAIPPVSTEQSSQLHLHDIHLPEQVSNFPIAPGWWLILAAILITALWSYKKYQQKKCLNACKNQALTFLSNNTALSAKECISLLKWAAMQYFPRQQLAKIYGADFQLFLTKQLPEKHQNSFSQLTTAAFSSQYQSKQESGVSTDQDCQQATKLWLNYALPIQKSLAIKNTAESSS